MTILDGYRVAKCLSSGEHTQVHSAIRERDGLRVVLKAHTGSSAAARAEREFQALRTARGPGVPEAFELQRQGESAVLALAHVDGTSLAACRDSDVLQPLATLLRVILELSECIAHVHQTRILHKDIRPENVLIDRVTQRPWLIDFGRSALLGSAADRRVDFSEGTLLYVSPEGTGRMDRGLDARSDLYSLGATLYHVLTGRPPFDLHDPLELVHAHMALLPRPPMARRPECPATLSRIVMKLLQKEPEERYQSARALCDDVRSALEQLERAGAIADDFVLGAGDTPQRPLFPRRLYGREVELAALTAAFARASGGSAQAWLIKGPSGAGKSALAEELKGHIHAAGGYLASGKFDLYRRELPYSGFVTAFDSLLQHRLVESTARLEDFRREVVAGLGNLAGSFAELVPDLRLVIGDVSAPPRLEPEQVRVRLALAVQRFVRACATPEHPLVLCLDDLQWADGGSLRLIEELCRTGDVGSLLLLGTYRDAEIDADHPLSALLARLEEADVAVHTLEIGPLGESACAEMLASALQRLPEETLPLARQVALKTANLPLLIEQFIGHARELGLLSFVNGRGWTWDEAGIRAAAIPESAVGLLAAKIERLDPNARRVLELASCVGDRFDAELLAELGGGARESLSDGLYILCDEGLITPGVSGFQFVHDRIREAAHALLPESQRARSHHRFAQLLQARLPADARAERVLELADHFNRALGELREDERMSVVELNFAAAERALSTGAPTTAEEYLSRARALYRDEDWSVQPELGFNLWLRSAACAYQLGRLEACATLLDAAWPRARSPIQMAAVTAHRIAVHASHDQLRSAVELGLTTLKALGIRWPLRPSALRVRIAEARLALALGGRGPEAFQPAPGYTPTTLATFMLMAALGGPAARVEVRLVSLIAATAARMMVYKGYSRGPDLALAALASDLCARATRVHQARRYAEIASRLSESVGDPVYRYRARCVLHGNVYPWLQRRVDAVAPLRQISHDAMEMGDREYAQYAFAQWVCARAFSGVPLAVFESDYAEYLALFPHGFVNRSLEALQRLSRPVDDSTIDEELARVDTMFAEQPMLSVHWRLAWMLTLCVLDRPADAFAQSERLRDATTMETLRVDLAFLRGLSAADLASAGGPRRRELLSAVKSSIRQLAAWARHGPDYLHMVEILRAALRGRTDLARAGYAAAARRAQQQGYLHHAALACEREARLLAQMRRDTEAALALDRARALYERWGARTKVERLQRERDRRARA